MGARTVQMVILDGELKVAQYGQWNAYLDQGGANIVDFILNEMDKDLFKEKLRGLKWITDKDIDDWNEDIFVRYPALDRDVGSDIFYYIQCGTITEVYDKSDFVNDSLFCEWAYLINMDTEELEIYEGFQKNPIDSTERFYAAEADDNGYYPVKLYRKFKFSELTNTLMDELELEYYKNQEN